MQRGQQGSDGRIRWQQADALHLPFPDGHFDVVCCQFGVMFFPDRVAGYREALRVVETRWEVRIQRVGSHRAQCFCRYRHQSCRLQFFPDDPPMFLARTPHGYHDAAAIRADVKAAGFADVSIETVTENSAAASHRDPAIAFCQGTPLRNEIEMRDAQCVGTRNRSGGGLPFGRRLVMDRLAPRSKAMW